MKKLSTDGIAWVTSGIGMALMILTAVWRVNPVEGSVVPDFLASNPFGEALLYVLLVTCMPVWVPPSSPPSYSPNSLGFQSLIRSDWPTEQPSSSRASCTSCSGS
jgi:hypothetical protein